jgi:hypothetical protein
MTIFDTVRQLLSQGETAQALRALINHLEKARNNPAALRILRVLEANYNSIRKNEIKGILSFAEVQQANNKTYDALLSITEDLEAGRTIGYQLDSSSSPKSRIPWLIGGGILLLLGSIIGILLLQNQQQPQEALSATCPDFDKKDITVMIIPFNNLGGEAAKPEFGIQSLIRDLTGRNAVSSDVEILPGNRFADNPPDMEEAMQLGVNCAASMVIWGQYEKQTDGITLDVRYVFTKGPKMPGGAIAETIKNISEIKSGTAKFNSLEDAVFSLCTAMALHEGQVDLAQKWLGKVKELSPKALELKEKLKIR